MLAAVVIAIVPFQLMLLACMWFVYSRYTRIESALLSAIVHTVAPAREPTRECMIAEHNRAIRTRASTRELGILLTDLDSDSEIAAAYSRVCGDTRGVRTEKTSFERCRERCRERGPVGAILVDTLEVLVSHVRTSVREQVMVGGRQRC